MDGDKEKTDAIALLGSIEIAKREVLIKLAEEEPWLFEDETGLYHLVKKLGSGKKTFTIHFKNGHVEEVVIHTNVTHRYKKAGT